ncbi:uncharacterized protein B0H18DRAFT_232244 [Fomitopsis serialis]|uniref:uncharacterized protein n=1 Tax=Fomitopsis serialis TaxID=139415 RepID=UPI002008D824|nr:uncharacterized protein B0H18DRAFT_232244 [Neoantrodia serialis]KAH9928853.1 hypothetical protein B0H18DRAFT_232244 [Neoantrodia serialis]
MMTTRRLARPLRFLPQASLCDVLAQCGLHVRRQLQCFSIEWTNLESHASASVVSAPERMDAIVGQLLPRWPDVNDKGTVPWLQAVRLPSNAPDLCFELFLCRFLDHFHVLPCCGTAEQHPVDMVGTKLWRCNA